MDLAFFVSADRQTPGEIRPVSPVSSYDRRSEFARIQRRNSTFAALVVLWLAVVVGTTWPGVRTQMGRLAANLGPLFFFCIVPLDPESPLARSFCASHCHRSFLRLRAIENYRFYDSVVTPSYRLVLL